MIFSHCNYRNTFLSSYPKISDTGDFDHCKSGWVGWQEMLILCSSIGNKRMRRIILRIFKNKYH